jgi:iron complex outermembrane receptor protein
VDLEYKRDFQNELSLMARASFHSYYFEADYPYDYRENETDPPDIVLNTDEGLGNWWGTEVQLAKTFLKNYKLVVGGEFRHLFQQDQSNFDKEPFYSYLDLKDSTEAAGAYLQGEAKPLEGLIINAGVRYDHYMGAFGGSVNPRGAVIYSPIENTNVKVLVGTAFRAPNAYERFYSWGVEGDGDAWLVNPDIKPETIQTYEAIVEQFLGQNVRVQLGGYYYKINDLIALTETADLDVIFRNVDEVDAMGLEAELEARWRGVRGRASYALQRARDSNTEESLVNSPRHMAKLNLAIPLLSEKLFLALEAQAMSARRTLRGKDVRAHWIANTTLFSQKLIEGVTLSTSIKNIFDATYSDPGSQDHIQRAIRQNGRTFWVSASYHLPL